MRILEHATLFLGEIGALRTHLHGATVAEVFTQAQRGTISADAQADLRMETIPEQKTALRAKARRWMAMWSPGCRRLITQVVLDDDGVVAQSPVVASDLMVRHWAPVFSNDAPTDGAAEQELWAFVQKFRGTVELASLDEFADLVARTSSTALGPDGLC